MFVCGAHFLIGARVDCFMICSFIAEMLLSDSLSLESRVVVAGEPGRKTDGFINSFHSPRCSVIDWRRTPRVIIRNSPRSTNQQQKKKYVYLDKHISKRMSEWKRGRGRGENE